MAHGPSQVTDLRATKPAVTGMRPHPSGNESPSPDHCSVPAPRMPLSSVVVAIITRCTGNTVEFCRSFPCSEDAELRSKNLLEAVPSLLLTVLVELPAVLLDGTSRVTPCELRTKRVRMLCRHPGRIRPSPPSLRQTSEVCLENARALNALIRESSGNENIEELRTKPSTAAQIDEQKECRRKGKLCADGFVMK